MRRMSLILAAFTIGIGLVALPAGAATVAPLVLVSGPSPYAGCTIGGPGTNYLNAEVEPWVAVNPANPSNIIGVYAPNFQFFNDKEAVTADPTTAGSAYVVWDRLAGPSSNPDASLHTRAFTGPAMFSKTTDDGATWTAPQVIANLQTVFVRDPNTGQDIRTGDILPDAAIDPATGQLYAVWQDSRFNG